MARYAQHFTPHQTPQSEPAKPTEVKNNAGGYVFAVDKWMQLDRFLVLGAEGGTYYATERKLAIENAKGVLACLAEDGVRVVARTVEISDAGRAPKNDPALFVLALAAAANEDATRAAALAALPKVARIGTHLFHFVDAVQQYRGWGPALKKAVTRWYTEKRPEKLAVQVLKYQQRDLWRHRDLLRLSHGAGAKMTPAHAAIFEWIRAGTDGFQPRDVVRKGAGRVDHYPAADREALPAILSVYEQLKGCRGAADVARLIRAHGFTREMVPSQHLQSKEVWEALLEEMGLTAMIRNLGKMTSIGLVGPLSAASKKVAEALTDRDALARARVHPIALLSALMVYQQGHGEKGKLSWSPDRVVVDALDAAYYLSFETIEPTGKDWLLGIDISGSMSSGAIAGVPGITPRVAAAAMAMVTARSEKNWHALGFTAGHTGHDGLTPLSISPRQRLDDIVAAMARLPMGSTDCALPIMWALQNKVHVDVFATYTDNETWAGPIHVFEALRRYRREMNPKAKLIACAFTADKYSIADPDDGGMMDVVGFDTATPSIMAEFAKQ